MKKRFGIAFPSEVFDSKDEAMKYATDLLTEEEISAGLYVFEASAMVHLKTKKTVEEVTA